MISSLGKRGEREQKIAHGQPEKKAEGESWLYGSGQGLCLR